MGLAYEDQEDHKPSGGAHLREALDCFHRCLRVYTESAFPREHEKAIQALEKVRRKLGL